MPGSQKAGRLEIIRRFKLSSLPAFQHPSFLARFVVIKKFVGRNTKKYAEKIES